MRVEGPGRLIDPGRCLSRREAPSGVLVWAVSVTAAFEVEEGVLLSPVVAADDGGAWDEDVTPS